MLNKAMQKGVIVTMLVLGMLLTTAAPAALAKDKNCKKGAYYTSSYYNNDYNDRDYNDRYSRRRSRDCLMLTGLISSRKRGWNKNCRNGSVKSLPATIIKSNWCARRRTPGWLVTGGWI